MTRSTATLASSLNLRRARYAVSIGIPAKIKREQLFREACHQFQLDLVCLHRSLQGSQGEQPRANVGRGELVSSMSGIVQPRTTASQPSCSFMRVIDAGSRRPQPENAITSLSMMMRLISCASGRKRVGEAAW
jgi:hypothetical protein